MDNNKPQELIDYELEKQHMLEEREEKRKKKMKVRKRRKNRHYWADHQEEQDE